MLYVLRYSAVHYNTDRPCYDTTTNNNNNPITLHVIILLMQHNKIVREKVFQNWFNLFQFVRISSHTKKTCSVASLVVIIEGAITPEYMNAFASCRGTFHHNCTILHTILFIFIQIYVLHYIEIIPISLVIYIAIQNNNVCLLCDRDDVLYIYIYIVYYICIILWCSYRRP